MLACDLPACNAGHDEFNLPVLRLNCGHSYHKMCLTESAQPGDHRYSLAGRIKCFICSEQLPLRIEELAKSFNQGLLAGVDDDRANTPDADDGDGPDSDDDDDPDNNDDNENDSDDKDVAGDQNCETAKSKLLLKAQERFQKLSWSPLFKYTNTKSRPTIINSAATTVETGTQYHCASCKKVYKTKRGWTLHQVSHKQ